MKSQNSGGNIRASIESATRGGRGKRRCLPLCRQTTGGSSIRAPSLGPSQGGGHRSGEGNDPAATLPLTAPAQWRLDWRTLSLEIAHDRRLIIDACRTPRGIGKYP